jgi:hypothetical protein
MKYRIKQYTDGYGMSVYRVEERTSWCPFWKTSIRYEGLPLFDDPADFNSEESAKIYIADVRKREEERQEIKQHKDKLKQRTPGKVVYKE